MRQRLKPLCRLFRTNWPFALAGGALVLGYRLLDPAVACGWAETLSSIPHADVIGPRTWKLVLSVAVPFAAVLWVVKLLCTSWGKTLLGMTFLAAMLSVLFWADPGRIGLYVDILYAGFGMVFVSGWLACKLYDVSRRNGAVALGFVAFMLFGVVMYEYLDGRGVFAFLPGRVARPAEILDCVFGVIDKPKDICTGESVQPVSEWVFLVYYLFHAMLAFYTGFVAVGFVSKAAVNFVLLRFRRCPHHVFWGISPEALALARNLGHDVVFVLMDPGSREFDSAEDELVVGRLRDRLDKEGFLWVVHGAGGNMNLLKSGQRHYFLTSSGADNVRLADALARNAKNMPDAYVRIEEDADDAWLYKWANSESVGCALNVHIIRETSQVADLFVYEHPLLTDEALKAENVKVLLVGLGWQGKMLLSRMVCDAQAPGVTFSCDVIDASQRTLDLYAERNPDAVLAYGLKLERLDVLTKAFFDWMRTNVKAVDSYTRIVIATGDDRTNLSVADAIVDHLRSLVCDSDGLGRLNLKERLFVRVRHPECYAGSHQDNPFAFSAFGAMKDTYSSAMLDDSGLEKTAKRLNAHYAGVPLAELDSPAAVRTHWRKTSFFNRESSRASVLGFRNLRRLCEYRSKSAPGANNEGVPPDASAFREWWDRQIASPEMLFYLCQAEHMRWNAYHRVRGVRTWDVKAHPGLFSVNPGKANLVDKANRHAALGEYPDLAEVERWLEVTYFESLKVECLRTRDGKAVALTNDSRTVQRVSDLFAAYSHALKKLNMKPQSADGKCFKLYDRLSVADDALLRLNRVVHVVDKMLKFWNGLIQRGDFGCRRRKGVADAFASMLCGFVEMVSKNGGGTESARLWLQEEFRKVLRPLQGWTACVDGNSRQLLRELTKLLESLNSALKAKAFVTTSNLIENDVKVIQRVPDYLGDGQMTKA